MKKRFITTRLGLTLLEVMLSIIILSIVTVGAAAFVGHSFGAMQRAKQRQCAVALAENTLEMLMNSTSTQIEFSGNFNVNTPYYLRLVSNTSKNWVTLTSPDTFDSITVDNMDYHVFLQVTKKNGVTTAVLTNAYQYYDVNVNVKWDNSLTLGGGITTRRAYE